MARANRWYMAASLMIASAVNSRHHAARGVGYASKTRTPVALMRQPAWLPASFWMARKPVLGGASLPQMTARQCMCSGVYLSMRWRPLASSRAYTGTDWNRRQPDRPCDKEVC